MGVGVGVTFSVVSRVEWGIWCDNIRGKGKLKETMNWFDGLIISQWNEKSYNFSCSQSKLYGVMEFYSYMWGMIEGEESIMRMDGYLMNRFLGIYWLYDRSSIYTQ